jgi:hypothetical protein
MAELAEKVDKILLSVGIATCFCFMYMYCYTIPISKDDWVVGSLIALTF